MFENLENRRLYAAGALDLSFSDDGKATFNLGPDLGGSATDVAVQADGKTVVVGNTRDWTKWAVARFNLDGTPDLSFGGGTGRVLTHIGGTDDIVEANAVAIQPDGKIIVVGSTEGEVIDVGDMAVARYNPDGSLDKTFDGDGKKSISFGTTSSAVANDVALYGDGRIVIVGWEQGFYTDRDFAVAQLLPNGSLDPNFQRVNAGGAVLFGKRLIGMGGSDDGNAVAIDYSGSPATNPYYGSIVIAGESFRGGVNDRFAVARIRANGAAIKSFDGDGKLTTVFNTRPNAGANDLLVQDDGAIVVVGSASDQGGNGDIALIRYLPNGVEDQSFGDGVSGSGRTLIDRGSYEVGSGIIRNFEGTGILVSGSVEGKFAVASLNNNGTLNSSFGVNGIVQTNTAEGARAIAPGPGRRFVMTGGSSFGTARYLDTGANVVSAGSFNPTAYEHGQRVSGFTVARSERLPVPTRVYFKISGTAFTTGVFLPDSGVDYVVNHSTLYPNVFNGGGLPYVEIPAGQQIATVTLTPFDDKLVEGIETAVFSIIPNASYELGTPAGTSIDIIDDELAGTLLKATSDAYVRDGGDANKNFGAGPELLAKNSTSGFNREIYMKFDLSNVNRINNAQLQLFGGLNNANQPSVTLSVFGSSNTSWSETGINFNNKPATTGSALASTTIAGTTNKVYEWNLTAYLQQQKALGKTSVTLVIRSNAKSDPFAKFNSREAGKGPQIVVT